MSKILGVIRLFRPINCLMMGFAVIVGALLVARGGVLARGQPLGLLLGFLAGFALTGASMAVNDYCDREIDAINEPSRPIPSGAVGACEALFYAFLLATIGFISALLNNLRCLSVAAVAFLLLVLYVTKGKRTGLPGNLMVSACVSIPFVYGAFIVKEELDPVVALFIAMVFLSNTGREVTKGIVDIPGDRSKGVKTIASSFGKRAAAATATLFFATSVSLSPLPWVWGLVSAWYLPFVLLTDIGLIYSSTSLLRSYTCENARRVKNLVLVWMLSGLFAFAFGSL